MRMKALKRLKQPSSVDFFPQKHRRNGRGSQLHSQREPLARSSPKPLLRVNHGQPSEPFHPLLRINRSHFETCFLEQRGGEVRKRLNDQILRKQPPHHTRRVGQTPDCLKPMQVEEANSSSPGSCRTRSDLLVAENLILDPDVDKIDRLLER